MIPPFDIFKLADDGQPVWVESSLTLDTAHERVQTLGKTFPGEYIIVSQKTGRKTLIIARKSQNPS